MTTKGEKIKRLLALSKKGHTLVGPYDDGDGNPKYMILHKTTKRILATTRDKAVAEVIVPRWETDGGVLKVLSPQERQAKKTSAAAAAPVKEFIEAKLDASQPIQFKMVADFNFDQVVRLNLGRMVYDRLLEDREIFKEKTVDPETGKETDVNHFEFEFSADGQLEKTEENAKKIVAAYTHAIDYLVGGRKSAEILKGKDIELGKKDQEMKFQLLTTEALRRKIMELEWDVGYWQRYGRLAVSMMPPEIGGEFWRKMEIITQLEMNAKGIEAFNAQMAARLTPALEKKEETAKNE